MLETNYVSETITIPSRFQTLKIGTHGAIISPLVRFEILAAVAMKSRM
jgi:hypothetical protein